MATRVISFYFRFWLKRARRYKIRTRGRPVAEHAFRLSSPSYALRRTSHTADSCARSTHTRLLVMDAFHFDSYTSYSDASTPRTPSPRTSVCSADDVYAAPSPHFKHQVDVPIFERADDGGIVPEPHAIKAATQMWNYQYNSYPLSQNLVYSPDRLLEGEGRRLEGRARRCE